MNKQEKIKKVMREFKNGTLKSSDGKKVTSRKQALAIAMSESEDYAEKADLISAIRIDSVREAEEILKAAGTEGDLFEKAHKVGDVHPNGKWVWTEYKPGKFDWRGVKGGTKGGDGSGNTTPAPKKTSVAGKTKGKKDIYGDNGYMSKDFLSYLEENKEKIWPKANWSNYTNIKIKHIGSKKSNYVVAVGENKNGVTVEIDDAYITGEGTNFGVNQVSPNAAIKKLVEDYKNGKKSTTKKSEKPYIYNDGGMVGGKTQIKDEDGLLKVLNGAKSNTVLIYDKDWKGLNSEAKKIGEKNGWKVEVGVDKDGNPSSTGSYIMFKKNGTKSTSTTKKTLPDKIVEIHNDLDEKYGEDIKPFTYTSNGVSDLNKKGKKGFATWIGFEHKSRGRQPVDKTKMKNFVKNTAIKQFLQEVNAKTGKKFSEDDVKIDDYWDTTDMFRIYV